MAGKVVPVFDASGGGGGGGGGGGAEDSDGASAPIRGLPKNYSRDNSDYTLRYEMANQAYAKMEEEVDLSEAQKLLGDITEADFRKLARDGNVKRGDVEKSMYQDVFALNKCLKNQSTVLLDGDWIIKHAAAGKTLPRRQDLPRNAIFNDRIGPPDMGSPRTGPMGFANVFVIAISYCWASKEHPDPHGYQLKKIARVIQFMRSKKCQKEVGKKKIAVFLDWSSLHQSSGGEKRTPEEEELFQIGLRNVNIWYAHPGVFKLVLSALPPKCQERANYYDSGWTTFEFAVAGLISHPLNVWDAEELEDSKKFRLGSCSSFKIMRNKAARQREVLHDPVSMEAVIMSKTFTSNADKGFVVKKYRQTFSSVVMTCDASSTLDLSADRKTGHGCAEDWSEDEWQHFFDTIMRFFVGKMGCVDLSYNTSLKNITLPPEVLQLSTRTGTPLKMLRCPGPFFFPAPMPKDIPVDWPQVLKFLGPRLGGGVLPGGLVRALNSGETLPSALKAKEHDISFSLPAEFSELDDIEELHLSSMGKLLSGEICSVELFDGLAAMNELHVEQTNMEFASWVISLLKESNGRLVEIKELPKDIFVNGSMMRGYYGSIGVIQFVGEHLEILEINPNGRDIEGNISVLAGAPNLKCVDVSFSSVSGNISVFQYLQKLETVKISMTACSGNISAFHGLVNLETCDLMSATSVRGNIAGFSNNKRLQKLNCYGTKCDGDVASLRDALPDCLQIEVPEEFDKKGKHLRR